ncbi:hypothetical protein TrVFT333_007920 [Trichoderma virens FT-333]|nr:hypothetical protein TrVFT333_007920 [Trichoderma virens FT-333]
MLGLMNHWSQAIEKLRAIEIDVSGKFRILRVSAIIIGNVPGSLAPFVTLAIYSLIALSSGDQSLLVTQAFTSLALINLVTEPLLMFCQALPSLTQAVSCFSRIEKFLEIESPPWHWESHSLLEEDASAMPLHSRAGRSSSLPLVTFQSADISWFPKNHQGKVILRNLNFSIPAGFTAIVGPVGSGKSSLLASIIGETTIVSGEMQSHITSRVAFCSQKPWLTNDTIKRNIIGELEFDQAWFNYVVQCCALREDLNNLPDGVMTIVGENGSSLSGGQRQRVALARAVYSKLPAVVLDDFISGLDPEAAQTVQTSLFHTNGHFRRAGISVVLATNGLNEEISARPEVESQGSNSTAPRRQGLISSSNRDEFSRQKGSWSVYAYYGEKAGKLSLLVWALSTLIGAISNSYSRALAVTLVAIALSLTDNSLGPGALGVALVMTLQFNGLLIQTIQSWTKLETSIGAVARVQQFVKEVPSDLGRLPAPSNSWPQSGRVQVQRLTAAHSLGSEDVLKDVNLDISAGEKIAVCGPSGSGKTSLIMAMMQMMDVRSGRVVIDDTDVATLDGESMRSHLNVVPQEPFFMPGSLRFNLDPRGVASDASIEAMLRRVSAGLWDKLATGSHGSLHEEFRSSQWSHGEQQLFCLTRALLIPSKVIIFDEAMSSVDEKTESLMQHIVEAEFKDRTVISIIHRYSHIDWFDRIAVLRKGRIVEYDSGKYHMLTIDPRTVELRFKLGRVPFGKKRRSTRKGALFATSPTPVPAALYICHEHHSLIIRQNGRAFVHGT